MSRVINDSYTPPPTVPYANLSTNDAFVRADGSHGLVTSAGAINLMTGSAMSVAGNEQVVKRALTELSFADPA